MRTPRSLFFMILCLWLGVVFDAYAAQGYRVGVGQTVTVNEWSVCKTVTNGAGADIFVPTNSSGEWSSFYSHLPGGVSTGSCVTPGAADYGTPGSYTFTVPAYNTLTVQIWGAGGGGVQGYTGCVGGFSLQTAGTGGKQCVWRLLCKWRRYRCTIPPRRTGDWRLWRYSWRTAPRGL